MRIDFVSDVACPWCAVGLNALEEALCRIGPQLQAELHFEPFEHFYRIRCVKVAQ